MTELDRALEEWAQLGRELRAMAPQLFAQQVAKLRETINAIKTGADWSVLDAFWDDWMRQIRAGAA